VDSGVELLLRLRRGSGRYGTGVYVLGGVLFGNALLRKYDTDGNELWTHQLSGAATGTAAVATDATGVYVTLPGPLASVHKISPDGTELWTRSFGEQLGVPFTSVAVVATGVYALGYSQSGTSVVKYDAAGNKLWSHELVIKSAVLGPLLAADATAFYLLTNNLTKYDADGGGMVWERRLDGGYPLPSRRMARVFTSSGTHT